MSLRVYDVLMYAELFTVTGGSTEYFAFGRRLTCDIMKHQSSFGMGTVHKQLPIVKSSLHLYIHLICGISSVSKYFDSMYDRRSFRFTLT